MVRNKNRKARTAQSKPAIAKEFKFERCAELLKLKEFCTQNNLAEPVVKVVPLIEGVTHFMCRIQAGTVAANDPSYRAKTPEEAIDHVAKLALQKLHMEAYRVRTNSNQRLSNCSQKTLLKRISDILAQSPAGYFRSKVEEIYAATYSETLPSDWFAFVKGCDLFDSPSPSSTIVGLAPNFSLPALDPPFAAVWNVVVKTVLDTDQVWVQFVETGYADSLFGMLCDVKNAVDANKITFGMTKTHGGSTLLARVSDFYARVRVLSAETTHALCEMIDLGGSMVIPLEDLAPLPCVCKKLAPQAIRVKLHGVEHFAKLDEKIVEITRQLVNIAFSAYHEQEADGTQSLILYSFGTTEGKSVNSALVDDIVNTLYKPGFELASCGQVLVTHVSSEMELCVQTQPVAVNWLYRELTAACLKCNLLEEAKPGVILVNAMYVVIVDNKVEPLLFRRGLVLEIKKAALCMMALVLLVDTGETICTPDYRIRNFPSSPFDFTQILPQATKCILGSCGEQVPTFDQLKNLELSNCAVNLRVLSKGGGHKLPVVQIAL